MSASPLPPSSSQARDERVDFVMELGRSLHEYGTPAYRLEQALTRVADSVGLIGEFFAMPTAIFAGFRDGAREITRLARVQPGAVDLEKLWLVDRLGDQARSPSFSLRHGLERLRRIHDLPNRYGPWVTIFAFGVSSTSVSCLLHGGINELWASFLVGLLVGAVTQLGRGVKGLGQISETVAALLSAVAVYLLAALPGRLAIGQVMLAGLIVLMPGLSFTLGMAELATQNLVAGTARLMGAATSLLKLTFGVVLGTQIMTHFFPGLSELSSRPVPYWVEWPALLASALAFTVLFRAHPRHVLWVALAALAGHLSASWTSHWVDPTYGTFAGALVVSAGSNAVSRWRDQPASITLIPGIILLVPGSLGYRSVSFLYEKQVETGVDTAFTMVTIGVTLVAGLLFGNMLVQPRRSL